tara:strand:+ start:490 stop:792 length:303 start_codon:yes stop_codon:yes gene_type:complete
MNRYRFSNILKNKLGKRYFSSIMYPEIKIRNNDIYIYAKAEDRIDLLAYKYYGDVTLWWVIAKANHLGKGTLRLEPGKQLRIPRAIDAIMEDFRKLNKDI